MIVTNNPTAFTLILLVLAPAAGFAQAPKKPAELLDRIDLVCIEQPANRVVFGDDGSVDYREIPPAETEPVTLSVTRADPGGDYPIDAARIDSTVPYLAVENATWTAGHQVDARQGQLRINLETDVLTLTETDHAGQAAFRRFECERQPAED
ncbi:MAG: hypothetical protein K9M02_14755 [Thiohalocapsa sp.]|jgi:hypothetical protein|nr:hypothetical protein [Thiohalocapsa sp.]